MELRKIDLNKIQDYAFTANEIAMSPVSSWNNKFINIKCLDNESIIPTIKAIPLDKLKQAMEEIENLSGQSCMVSDGVINEALDILDKLIAESESE